MELDLSRYATPYHGWGRSKDKGFQLVSFQTGRLAAKELKVPTMVGEEITLRGPLYFLQAVDVMFMTGLLRSLSKKQGLDKTGDLVTSSNPEIQVMINEFLAREEMQARKKEEKAEEATKLGKWSAPIQFFIPEIGTTIRLKKDWTFRLYNEGRNSALLKMLEIGWHYDWGRPSAMGVQEVTMNAGTVLKVSRIYIRQGVKNYSSLTFTAQRGDGAVVHDTRTVPFKKKGARFWAKLSDVNKMVVEVDTATLAEN